MVGFPLLDAVLALALERHGFRPMQTADQAAPGSVEGARQVVESDLAIAYVLPPNARFPFTKVDLS